jgi:hypothetical protein
MVVCMKFLEDFNALNDGVIDINDGFIFCVYDVVLKYMNTLEYVWLYDFELAESYGVNTCLVFESLEHFNIDNAIKNAVFSVFEHSGRDIDVNFNNIINDFLLKIKELD